MDGRCVWHWLFEKSTIKLNKPHWSTLFFINCAPTRLASSRLAVWQVELSWVWVESKRWRCHQRVLNKNPEQVVALVQCAGLCPDIFSSFSFSSFFSFSCWAFDRRLLNSPCNLHTLKKRAEESGAGARGVSGFWCNVCWLWPNAPLFRRNPLTDWMFVCQCVCMRMYLCPCVCVCVYVHLPFKHLIYKHF